MPGREQMKNYKVYSSDGRKTWLSDWLRASSDTEAISMASAAADGFRKEIWEGSRRVAVLNRECKTASQWRLR